MKRLLVLLFFIYSCMANADAIEDVTEAQARKMANYLAVNPILLSYCDCCSNDLAVMYKVLSASVEKSSSDPSMFVVKYSALPLYEMSFVGQESKNVKLSSKQEPEDGVLNVNYMFVHSGNGIAKPIGLLLGIYGTSCINSVKLPAQAPILAAEAGFNYAVWYDMHCKGFNPKYVVDYYNMLFGSSAMFTFKNGKWLAPSNYEQGEVEAIVNDQDMRMSTSDMGGFLVLKVFKTDAGNVVGVSTSYDDGESVESTLQFYKYNGYWENVTESVMPAVTEADFMLNKKALSSDDGYRPNVIYFIAENSPTIKISLEYGAIEQMCKIDQDAFSCNFVKNVQYNQFVYTLSGAKFTQTSKAKK